MTIDAQQCLSEWKRIVLSVIVGNRSTISGVTGTPLMLPSAPFSVDVVYDAIASFDLFSLSTLMIYLPNRTVGQRGAKCDIRFKGQQRNGQKLSRHDNDNDDDDDDDDDHDRNQNSGFYSRLAKSLPIRSLLRHHVSPSPRNPSF